MGITMIDQFVLCPRAHVNMTLDQCVCLTYNKDSPCLISSNFAIGRVYEYGPEPKWPPDCSH